jgi:hypothetical protein
VKSWRDWARDAILAAKAEGERQGLAGAALEKHVRATGYPFGEREMHPYKIWCSEMKRQFPKPKKLEPIDVTDHPFLLIRKPKGA